MLREQKMDEEVLLEEQELFAYHLDENEIIFEGQTKEGPMMIKMMFIEFKELYVSTLKLILKI